MPELPEVQTVVSELNRKLKNRIIKNVEVRTPKIISIGPRTVSNIRRVSPHDAKKFQALLRGHKIVSVKRRAKLLIFDFSGPLSMLVHLKMTGQFIFEDKALRQKTGGKYRILNRANAPFIQHPTKYTHAIFKFNDGSVLYFNDVRQFGYLKIIRDDEVAHVKELNGFGPEPLSKQFTWPVFKKQIERYPRRAIKQALMDSTIIAGIGNIYSDEILFHSKVQPDRIVDSLSLSELKAVYKYIPIVLKQGIKYKGSSVGDFVRTDGSWGSMGKFHYVYGRGKQPCKVCGTMIKTIKLGGRTGSYCPRCQK
jgi:formamidopyrimidine-DNA glycosylase